MLDHDFLAICQFAVWDIVDLGVGVACRRHRAEIDGKKRSQNIIAIVSNAISPLI